MLIFFFFHFKKVIHLVKFQLPFPNHLLSGVMWMSVRSKLVQCYLDRSHVCAIQWSIWDPCGGLVHISALKASGMLLRVRSTHAQLRSEPQFIQYFTWQLSRAPSSVWLSQHFPVPWGPLSWPFCQSLGLQFPCSAAYFQQLCLSLVPSGGRTERGRKQ